MLCQDIEIVLNITIFQSIVTKFKKCQYCDNNIPKRYTKRYTKNVQLLFDPQS